MTMKTYKNVYRQYNSSNDPIKVLYLTAYSYNSCCYAFENIQNFFQ